MTDGPHDRLKLARARAGYREAKLAAEQYGWNYATYKSHESGGRGFRMPAAEVYAKAFGVSAAWLFTGETVGAPDSLLTRTPLRLVALVNLQSIDELTAVALGARPSGVSDVPVEADTDITPRSLAIKICDSSMSGRSPASLELGDTVIVSPEAQLDPGCFILAIVDQEAMIRKYRPSHNPNGVTDFTLVPINEDFPSIRATVADGAMIVGRAVRLIKRL